MLLKLARRAVERFRGAVAAAACSGHLTEDWREQNHGVGSGSRVLERIAELRIGNRKGIHPEAVRAPEDVSETPESWAWAHFGLVIAELRNGVSPAPAMKPPGIPILRISSTRAGRVDLSDVRYLRSNLEQWQPFALRDGDLLFTRYNGSLSLLGVCGMVRGLGDNTLLYPDKLMRVRFDHDLLIPEYVELFFASPAARQRMTGSGVSSAGQQGISGASVKAQPIAVPPIEEQAEIVRRVKRLLESADAISNAIDLAARRVDQTSQAVLAKAFRGELVVAATPTTFTPVYTERTEREF